MKGGVRLLDGELDVSESFDGPVTLEVLREKIGGDIEVVPAFDTVAGDPCVAFCDAKVSMNWRATLMWHEAITRAGFRSRLRIRQEVYGPRLEPNDVLAHALL